MLDWTDRHFRFLARQISRHALLYTEMVNAGAVVYGGAARFLLKNDCENPVALQLGGSEPNLLAQAARDMGASVHLIGANLEVPAPDGVELTRVVSAADLQRAVLKSISGADALVMSAAVADFRPTDYAEYKIKKTADPNDNPVIRLVRNPDILREVVQRRQQLGGGPRLIVGFAAETGSPDKTPLELGREKLTRKGCDFLAVNTVGISQGFGTDENTVTLISSLTDEAPVFSGSKGEVSRDILTTLATYL